jgi:hypothetical protein
MASQQSAGRKHGWRSGLEEAVASILREQGVDFGYEVAPIPFTEPAKKRRYTPDFWLPSGIIIETKGRFVTADRAKMKLVKEQHPDLDIRFVFSNAASRISKRSRTTYALWCDAHGFPWAHRMVPAAWLKERGTAKAKRAMERIVNAESD